MKLTDFVESYLNGSTHQAPGKLPWNRPDFSRRMLREHLSQSHDRASRRFAVIDRQVAWIHRELLASKPSSVLDLTCGPGLYCERLAAVGHACTGIDFSPASIEYATSRNEQLALNSVYVEADILTASYGSNFDLVLLLQAELNTFNEAETRLILSKASSALRAGGTLLIEVHRPEHVKRIGRQGRSWSFHREGLFGDRPYLLLREANPAPDGSAAVESFVVLTIDTLEVDRFRSTTYRVTRGEMTARLKAAGLAQPAVFSGLPPEPAADETMYVMVAKKPLSESSEGAGP